MRTWKRLLTLMLVLFMVSSIFVSACSKGGSGSNGKDVFIYATSNQAPGLDPANGSSNAVNRLISLLYDGLVTYAPDSTKVVAALADTWEASPDAKTFTFHIRQGAVFADGSPVTADAVKFTFDRIMKVGKLAAGSWTGIIEADTIKVIDQNTVQFNLKNSTPAFLAMMATPAGLIINPKIADHYTADDPLGETWLATHSIGSGRYVVESYVPNGDGTFVRNDKWYGPKSSFKKFVLRVVPEVSTQRMLLEKGEVDMLEGRFLDWDTINALKGEQGITVVSAPTMDILQLIPNGSKKPFSDVRVRQALSMVVDYDGIIKNIYGGNAQRLYGAIPEGLMGADPNAFHYNFDPAKAKELLAEAGYPNGLDVELSIGPIALWQKVATKIQSDGAQAGFRFTIREYALPALYQSCSDNKIAVSISGWTPDYADPDYNCWYFFYSGNAGPGYNWSFYKNKTVDDLLLQGRSTADPAQREAIYKQITDITNRDAVYVPIAQAYTANPIRSNIKGYVLNPMDNWALPLEQMSKE